MLRPKPTVSLIIPFYNVEAFIGDSIKSVLNQTFTDYECLCVDDGSVDKSRQIFYDLTKTDDRFILITQENKGLAGARNTGLSNAGGNWICFIDADDIIHPRFLENLLKSREKSVDYIFCNYSNFPEETMLEEINFVLAEAPITKMSKSPFYETLDDRFPFNVSSCMHLFHRSLFEEIRYDETCLIHEDTIIALKLLHQASTAVYVDENLYLYRQRKGSITRSNNYIQSINTLAVNAKEALELAKKWNLSEKFYSFFFFKAGIKQFGLTLIEILLNRNLPKEQRKQLFHHAKYLLFRLKKDKIFYLRNFNHFQKFGLFLSYYLNQPKLFRAAYSVLWRKQWKNRKFVQND